MRTAASVFSWLGGIVNAVILISTGARGLAVPRQACINNGYGALCTVVTDYVPTPGWLWAIIVVILVGDLAILIWRQCSVSKGNKTASGIFTLIFVSLIGGILTLCLPPEECGNKIYRTAGSERSVRTSRMTAARDASEPSDASYNPYYSEYHKDPSKADDSPEPVLGLKEGEKVRLKKDIKTASGDWITLGALGVVTTPNSRGEPVITFENGKRLRIIEKYLERVEKETKPE